MQSIPYGNRDYWENRYKTDQEMFEWYLNFIELEEHMEDYLSS